MALIKDPGLRGELESKLLTQGKKKIAGVDEAGRGPCAGPLVVAAVVLRDPLDPDHEVIKDSKKIAENRREELYDYVLDSALTFTVVTVSPAEIDKFGLHRSNLGAMKDAALDLNPRPDYVLFDGYEIKELELESDGIWRGDSYCITVAAASILAKVTRDRIMRQLDLQYPGYGFASHKGYSSPAHMKAIAELGITPIHRKSYANIQPFLAE
jgi:ribonuclease HII